MIKQSTLKKQHSFLQQDANNISILKKQISKQSQIDVSIQNNINQKIDILKQNAALLAKKLQNQKHTNVQLEMIINHIRHRLQKQKSQQVLQRQNNDNINNLDNKFKKYQYDLGQINGKANRISQTVQQKRTKINQIRTQRVIDSGIFRNIQKQLIQSQLKFKKLLIQKIKYEKQYQKLLLDYKQLKNKAENMTINNYNSKTKHSDKDNTFNINQLIQTKDAYKKFINLQINKDNNYKGRSVTKLQSQIQYQQQQKCIKIHKIINDLGISAQQLVNYYNNINQINQKYFIQINTYNDQISQIQKYMNVSKQIKNKQKVAFGHHQKALNKNQIINMNYNHLKEDVKLNQQQKNKHLQEIQSFFKDDKFKVFMKKINLDNICQKYDQNNFQELIQLLKVIQVKMENYLVQPCLQITKRSGKSMNKSQQKLQEMINQVNKQDQCLKIMKKQDFQDEYNKIMKSNFNKKASTKTIAKRKSNQFIKP